MNDSTRVSERTTPLQMNEIYISWWLSSANMMYNKTYGNNNVLISVSLNVPSAYFSWAMTSSLARPKSKILTSLRISKPIFSGFRSLEKIKKEQV
jgi:hypothetical protein